MLQKNKDQKLGKGFESNKNEEKTYKSLAKSNLIYSKYFVLQIPQH